MKVKTRPVTQFVPSGRNARAKDQLIEQTVFSINSLRSSLATNGDGVGDHLRLKAARRCKHRGLKNPEIWQKGVTTK